MTQTTYLTQNLHDHVKKFCVHGLSSLLMQIHFGHTLFCLMADLDFQTIRINQYHDKM